MSDRRRDDLLADLLDLAREIEGYVDAWTERDFLADRGKQRTLERTLELLGEVATRLGDDAPAINVDWKALRDLRVMLAHAYHRIDARRLWVHAARDVPSLRALLEP
ncbi:MAG: HepT-like ribonuclease domain-containing protein [Candidatus Thermoplasmatota archaeon]